MYNKGSTRNPPTWKTGARLSLIAYTMADNLATRVTRSLAAMMLILFLPENYGLNMMTSSNGNNFRVTGPLCGEFIGPGKFPAQRPVTRSFDVFFDLRLNKRLSKQPWGWWFETPSWSLWRRWYGPWTDRTQVGKIDTSNVIMIYKMKKYRYGLLVIKSLIGQLNTYNPIYCKNITKITDYVLDILWSEYDFKAIMYPAHGMDYILCSISGDKPQLIALTSQWVRSRLKSPVSPLFT